MLIHAKKDKSYYNNARSATCSKRSESFVLKGYPSRQVGVAGFNLAQENKLKETEVQSS